jgi:DNA-binding NtrC family response regulator
VEEGDRWSLANRPGRAALDNDLDREVRRLPNSLRNWFMADSNDLGLLSTVRRLSPHSQVILMSAYCTPEVTKEALALGAYRVVSKPINMYDVSGLVGEAAGSRSR